MNRVPLIRSSKSFRRWAIVISALALAAGFVPDAVVRAYQEREPSDQPSRLGVVVTVKDELTDITVESLQRRVERARAMGASVLILELNTPGGLVTSAIAIADLIKGITDMKTVAWVNTKAHSGGAMVAVACEEIVMARSSRIGDSQVIMVGPEGAEAVPDALKPKAYTPVIAEFRASATLRGYSPILAEAFVVPECEVWWVENKQTGEREFVFRNEKINRVGDPASDTSAATSPADREWKLVDKYHDILLQRDVPAVQPVDREDTLLEMSPSLAYAYGFSKGVVSTDEELRSRYQLTALERFEPSWSESLALWLTSPYVRGFLMIIFLLATYVEFHTAGVGLAGLVALISLGIFVGAPYMAGLANVWEILFIVAGLALIAFEVFVIPGFGIAGISGLILMLVGILASFAPPEPGRTFPIYIPSLPETVERLKEGIVMLSGAMVVSIAGMVMLSRYLPKIPFLRQIVPANPTPSQVLIDDPYDGAARVGDIGEAVGPLRPAGKARFGEMLVDVVTQGDFIEAGARLEVVERRGNRVVVRPIG